MSQPADFTGNVPTLNPQWKEALDKAMHQSLMRGGPSVSKDENDGGPKKAGGPKKKEDEDDDETLSDSDSLDDEEEEDGDEEEDDFPEEAYRRPPLQMAPPPSYRSSPPRPPPPPPSYPRTSRDEQPQVVYAHPGETASSIKARLEQNRALEREEKMELLGKLHYFENEKGFRPFKVLGPEDSIEDIRYEVFRAQREASKKRNVKFMQKALVSLGAGIEMANSMYNPLGLHLDGFSKSLLLSIKDYDDIFVDLHYKYADTVSMPPELRLIMTLGSSIFFFHMSQNNATQRPTSSSRPMSPPRSYASVPSTTPAPTSSSEPPPASPAMPQRKMAGPRSRMNNNNAASEPAAPAMDMTALMNGLSMVNTLISQS